MTKKSKSQKKEIVWNLVNSGLAGALVFLGSLTNGNITCEGALAAFVAAMAVALTKFKDYWSGEQKEYAVNLAKFI